MDLSVINENPPHDHGTEIEPTVNKTQTILLDTNANSDNSVGAAAVIDEEPPPITDALPDAEAAKESTTQPQTNEQRADLLTSFFRSVASEGIQKLGGGQPFVAPKFKLPWFLTGEEPGFNLVKFLTACIASQLKSLGVEELDCKELIDAWLSQRRQKRWGESAYRSATIFPNKPRLSSNPCLQVHQVGVTSNFLSGLTPHANDFKPVDIFGLESYKTTDVFGPSEPNSSLLRLSEDGNVELGKFLTRMEEVRANINNACCTLLHSVSLLMLPYLKLLTGNQLDSTCSNKFIEESMKLVSMMAAEINAESCPDETVEMTQREFRHLIIHAKTLSKVYLKLFKKFKSLFQENDEASERALGRIHPKGLVPVQKGRISKESSIRREARLCSSTTFITDCIQFSHIPLYHENLQAGDVCKDHLLLSKSSDGSLVYKVEISEEWRLFSELPFNKKRELFLSVAEDLQWCIKQATSSASHVKELVKKGYPENIYTKINENLEYLKSTAKKNSNELLVLSKVSIVTQVNSVRDASTRLIRVLRDACQISKLYCKLLQYAKKKSSTGCLQFANSCKSNSALVKNVERSSLKFDVSKAKLLVPLSASSNLIPDKYSFA